MAYYSAKPGGKPSSLSRNCNRRTGLNSRRGTSRENGKNSSDEVARAASLACRAQHILLDLEFRRAGADQQAVLNPTRTQAAQDLGHMFVRQGLGCFQLDDEAVKRIGFASGG